MVRARGVRETPVNEVTNAIFLIFAFVLEGIAVPVDGLNVRVVKCVPSWLTRGYESIAKWTIDT